MLVVQLKPPEEIISNLNGANKIFILSCAGCAEATKCGGEEGAKNMQKVLVDAKKNITATCVIDFLCDKALVKIKLQHQAKEVVDAEAVLVLSCGIGVQASAKCVDIPCLPACNTISLSGRQGEWRSEERCKECGDCVLHLTGGICPITSCTKGLLNGQCGGTKDGKCEFEPEVRDCGWHLIYERLKKLNKLDDLKKIHLPKNYSKGQTSKEIRRSSIWAIDV